MPIVRKTDFVGMPGSCGECQLCSRNHMIEGRWDDCPLVKVWTKEEAVEIICETSGMDEQAAERVAKALGFK